MRHKLILLIVALICTFLTMRTLWGFNFFRPHDFTHASRLVEMKRSLEAGEFPVRWSDNFGFGYGMPLFNFYAPLPYYLGQPFLFLGVNPTDTTKLLYIANALLAFAGMYLFASRLWGKEGGVLSAILFSFSSYRAVDLFVRGALGEAFAFALLPFALYGVLLVKTNRKLGIIITSLSLALVLLSHNLTGLFALAFILLYWLVTLPRKYLFFLLLTYLLAFTLSAFYTLPSFFEKGFTRVDETITVGYFDYHNHFLCSSQLLKGVWGYGGSTEGCTDGIDFAFGFIPLLTALLALIVILRFGKLGEKKQFAFLSILFLLATFMTIGRSQFLWDHLPLLKYVQFPWRFLTFSHVFLAALSGGAALLIRRSRYFLLLFIPLIFLLIFEAYSHFAPEKLLPLSSLDAYYNTSPAWIQSELSRTLNDYLPHGINDARFPIPASSRFTVIGGQIENQNNREVKLTCSVSCILNVNIFQFPGWTAHVDGYSTPLTPIAYPLPIYSLTLKEGKHTVSISLTNTPIRTFGNLLSILGILSLIGIMIKHSHYVTRSSKH